MLWLQIYVRFFQKIFCLTGTAGHEKIVHPLHSMEYLLPKFHQFLPIAGDMCAAKFLDNQWYRARVLKVSGNDATVLYIDYGNQATIPKAKCGVLPAAFSTLPAFAKERALAFMKLAPDVSF